MRKYKSESIRLKNWNYCEGIYFITICTKFKEEYFGRIHRGNLVLNDIGKITDDYWKQIPLHFKNVTLDKFIIMPNHIHGIIYIKDYSPKIRRDVALQRLYQYKGKKINMCIKSPQPGSLPTIIRSFKSACTKTINMKFPSKKFAWQSRYYEAIIKDKKQLQQIRNYIQTNPQNYLKNSWPS